MKPAVCAIVLLLAGCKDLPTVPPRPSPTPLASPPTPVLSALRIEDGRFRTDAGFIPLAGAIVCCEGYPENGWPLVSEPEMDRFLRHGINFVHVRTGPFPSGGDGEQEGFEGYHKTADGLYDLDRFNDEFFRRLSVTVSYAFLRGIYVEVDLIDGWRRRHWRVGDAAGDPWNSQLNIQREHLTGCASLTRELHPRQEAWIRKVVETTATWPNVLYQISNESFVCTLSGHSTADWEQAVYRLVKELAPARLVGSNSHMPFVGDYSNLHGARAVPGGRTKPQAVNEYEGEVSPEEVLSEVRRATEMGSYFWYWRGGHTESEWEYTLSRLKAAATPARR